MADLPSGDVTFLFTDIEGSTRLLERDPLALGVAMARHHDLLAGIVATHDGVVFETVGDAVYAAFGAPVAALTAASAMQRAMGLEDWGPIGELRIRISVHGGPVERRGEHYFGAPLFACARIQALAHGQQVLVSSATRDAVGGRLPAGLSLRSLGPQRLKDLADLFEVDQLVGPGLRDAFPPLRTGAPVDRSSMPAATSSFVGREAELDALVAAVLESRLVTVLGTGGTGKTRLAIEAARRIGPTLADGAHLVELASVADPERIADAVAVALHVRPYADQPPLAALHAHLADRELLLVIDNWEHVLLGAKVVAELLGRAPGLRILATSREPLGVPGEQRFPLLPLDPRDAGARLFVDRARAVVPDLPVGDEEWAAIVELCRRLDGLPLAIELAAARVALVPPSRLLERFPKRLGLAAGRAAGAAARQRTLRDAIAWSVDLLAPAERAGFAALGVFAGAFDLDGASAVVGSIVDDPIELVASLLDRSLLARRDADDRGEPRFGLLETLREYALELLGRDATAREGAIARHAAWVATITGRAESDLDGDRVFAGLAAISRDLSEIELAIERAAARGEHELACTIAADLDLYREVRGGRRRARVLLELALAGAEPGVPRTRAVKALGLVAQRLGDPEARRILVEAWEQSVALHDDRLIADSATNLGNDALFRGAFQEAAAWYLRSDDHWVRAGDPATNHRLSPIIGLATTEIREHVPLGRHPSGGEVLDLALAFRNDIAIEIAHHNLAVELRAAGDQRQALEHDRRSLLLAVELGSADAQLDDLEAIAEGLVAHAELETGVAIFGGCASIRQGRPENPIWSTDDGTDALGVARSALSQARFDASIQQGACMSLEQLVDVALDASSAILEPTPPV